MLVLAGMAMAILASPSLHRAAPPTAVAPVKQIGEELMTRYVLPLEMVGVLLTRRFAGRGGHRHAEEPKSTVRDRHLEPDAKEAMVLR